MKKLITALAGTGLLTLTLGLVGCGDTSTEKKEGSTPGGMATSTEKKDVKPPGTIPPPAGATTPAAPK